MSRSIAEEVNYALSAVRSHHTHIFCQLCTGPYWSTEVNPRSDLIDRLEEHMVVMHGYEKEEE